MRRFVSVLAVLGCLVFCTTVAFGKDGPNYHPVFGPSNIQLGRDLATLELPAGFVFLDKEETIKVLKADGNFPSGQELGLIASRSKDDRFFIIIEFEDVGYIRDDDAGKLDADALLKNFTDATESNNAERKKRGFPEMHVTGWSEKPHYQAASHQVLWAVIGKSADHESVNYFTRKLGRRGVLSLNLITGTDQLDTNKKKIAVILDKTQYIAGQRYEDFQPGKDKDSGLNLTKLIVGGGAVAAAAKLGLFAKLGSILLAMKKLVIVAVAGIASLFRKKKDPTQS